MKINAEPSRRNRPLMWLFQGLFLWTLPQALIGDSVAITLPCPPRHPDAMSGSQIADMTWNLPIRSREAFITDQMLRGNLPGFLKTLEPVRITRQLDGRQHEIEFHVTRDYLSIGSNEDYLRIPLSPGAIQILAYAWSCRLPNPFMVDTIHQAAPLKLEPQPIPPGPAMTRIITFKQHHDTIQKQLKALDFLPGEGGLIAGHKKDVVVGKILVNRPERVAIYGWHRPEGTPIQPLYAGHHEDWVDYSHGARLINEGFTIDGVPASSAEILLDHQLARLLSHHAGPINPIEYFSVTSGQILMQSLNSTWKGYESIPVLGEQYLEWIEDSGVRIVINSPDSNLIQSEKPFHLILYALPNGNTIEWTMGKTMKPDTPWRFDIQHVAAQTRFLRAKGRVTNLVVAYLETEGKSWPAWRRNHDNDPGLINKILNRIKAKLPSDPTGITLTGHSGGGALTFGFIDGFSEIPDEIQRIVLLDSNYAYDTAKGHGEKLIRWLKNKNHTLCVMAYDDARALLNGKPFVSAKGGTWGRSHAMLEDLGKAFALTIHQRPGLNIHRGEKNRIQFLLKENPDRAILHTVQVEKNGLIHGMLAGTSEEEKDYLYYGPRAYTSWIRQTLPLPRKTMDP